jgi:diguanylate cyclase (GGDEF)-like protein
MMVTVKTDSPKKFENLMPCLQIGKLLTSTLNLSKILELIMIKISQLVEAENWSLLLKDEETGDLRFEVVVGIDMEQVKNIRIPLGKGIAGKVAQTGDPIILEDAQNDPRVFRKVDQKTGFITKSIICLPLKIHGKILGVIETINIGDMEEFKQKKLPMLSILADYAAIAIENSQYMSKIQRMSITDEYTSLYNAGYMHQILPGLIKDADESGKKVAVVFMDIDNFKNVVDTYGHLSGSMVLKEIGEVIAGCLTEKEILIKYGGDEYIIIMPERDKSGALTLTKKIQDKIRGKLYLQTESHPVKLTASFGLAIYPDDADSKKDLLLRADGSMYKVKKSTKNDIGTAE